MIIYQKSVCRYLFLFLNLEVLLTVTLNTLLLSNYLGQNIINKCVCVCAHVTLSELFQFQNTSMLKIHRKRCIPNLMGICEQLLKVAVKTIGLLGSHRVHLVHMYVCMYVCMYL